MDVFGLRERLVEDPECERVREIGDLRGWTTVTPQLPVDVLGAYVFLPAPVA